MLNFLRSIRRIGGLAVGMGWIVLAQAASTPGFSASVSGTESQPTLTATVRVADADLEQSGSIYLVACLSNACFAHDGTAWQAWLGGGIPAQASGPLVDRTIEVAREFDAVALAGARVYLGYGRDMDDMLANGKYGMVYTVPTPTAEARSTQARNSVAPATADTQALARDNRDFAFDMYQQLLSGRSGENLFFSPLSISTALAMTTAGARGTTATEMASALRFTLPQERLHPAFGWLDLDLARRGQGAQGRQGQAFQLALSNSLWGEQRANFANSFLDTLAQHYGAGIKLTDFVGTPDASREKINDWVAQRTAQRIRNLLPEGAVTTDTRLVLVNAVYFNAAWQSQFYPQATTDASFTRLDGTTGTVALMNQTSYFAYAEGDGYQAVELPYDGGELAMLILLPAAGQMLAFEQTLDRAKLDTIQAALAVRNVRVGLPKFKIEGGFSVATAMKALSMNAAFSDAADFSGIGAAEGWRISDIFHKGFVDVDETGTEAAAATGVVAGTTSVPPEPTVFRADRPFLFAIVDKPTNSLLFMGRVVAP